jgi:hypothetical protein
MAHEPLDRRRVEFRPLAEREDRVFLPGDLVHAGDAPGPVSDRVARIIDETAERIVQARAGGRPVVMAFGAHTIKNGLAPVLIHLMDGGLVTHLATNGAGIIHDWELAYRGSTSEHVQANARRGRFGTWEETGRLINLALLAGAWHGRGYGESVGRLVAEGGLDLPTREELTEALRGPDFERAGAAADILAVAESNDVPQGRLDVPHAHASVSAQAAACRLGVPFTGHPMIGHDIIYTHPLNCGAAVGRTAERDFLRFAGAIAAIEGGVYLSVGSAVMSPMIFEKSFSMAQNIALQQGCSIDNHFVCVVDLAQSSWDWSGGEPPEDHPDYYLRFCKTFHRMGGELRYACADNRDFLLRLCDALDAR